MPVLRNVYHSRQPGRLGKQRPVIYQGNGWPACPSTSENIDYRPNIESPLSKIYYSYSCCPYSTLRPLRAAPQVAVQEFLQPGSISPSSSHLPAPLEDSPMQENLEVAYPEPNPPAKMDVVVPTAGTRASGPGTPFEVDDFVPTADIPELELSPSEEPTHEFDLTMRPSNLNLILEQFGLNYHIDSTALLAHLPPMPNLDDTASAEDAAPSCSRTPATFVPDDSFECSMADNITQLWQPPTTHLKAPRQPSLDFSSHTQTPSTANFPITPISCNTSLYFSTDGNISDCYQQQSTNGLAASQQPAPYFTWPSDDENVQIQDNPMSSEDMMLEDDFSFLSYLFNLNPLNDPFFGYAMY